MKIATFNLRNLFPVGEYDAFNERVTYTKEFVERRLEQTVTTISQLEANVVVVNEIGSIEVLKNLANKLPEKYHYFMGKPEARGIANGVLYRGEQIDCKSFRLSPSLPLFTAGGTNSYAGELKSHRELIHLTITYAGRPLHIIGLHLKSSVPTPLKNQAGELIKPISQTGVGDELIRSALRRLGEARALRLMLDDMFNADSNLQLIVTGDFNDTENSATLRALIGESDLLPGALTNVCKRLKPAQWYSIIENGSRRLIDHILVSKSLLSQILTVAIKNDNLQDQKAAPNPAYLIDSDHAPIVVELKD